MKKITITVLLAILCFVLLLEPLTLAWMSDNGMSSLIDISGNVHKSYFAGGDGTEGDPFQIATPAQLYYFAWLQYLGLFNVDENKDGTIDSAFHFVLTADLDMDYTTTAGEPIKYILPPIGTKKYPFLGTFDGQGHTVTDLVVENVYSDAMDAPVGAQGDDYTGVEIVGFFGVVGAYNGQHAPSSVTPTVQNVALENLTVSTQTTSALIGLIAGYVNGDIDCAGVVGTTTMKIGSNAALTYTDKLSDYSLIGYCTPDYKDDMYVLDLSLDKLGVSGTELIVPEVQGTGSSGWGGSVTMESIYTWLYEVQRPLSQQSYIRARTDVVDLNEKKVTVSTTTGNKKVTTIENFGSFVFTNFQEGYNFMSGAQRVTEIRYSKTGEQTPVYYITDGTNYLNCNDSAVASGTDANSATRWYMSTGTNKRVYTVVDGEIFYLHVNNNAVGVISAVEANHNNLPTWTLSNGELRSNNQNLRCVNGTWQLVSTSVSYYTISFEGNYLRANNTTLTNTTDASQATVWALSTSGNSTTISTTVNGVTYNIYSSNNNNLQLSNRDSTNWTYNNGQFYTGNTTNRRYLKYEDSTWTATTGASTLTRTLAVDENKTAKTADAGTLEGVTYTESESIDNSLENGSYNANGEWVVNRSAGITYFPLSSDVNLENDSFNPSSNNTGYIVSAEWGGVNSDGSLLRDDYGNVRISRYAQNSMQNASTPYTMTYLTKGKFKTITSATDAAALQALGLQKYAACYNTYSTSITNYCYGLHFMDAPVSEANKTKITAYLNLDKEGLKTYTDYEVPTNCIDFSLNDRGFINFVAGSYYTQGDGNDSFFSIYEIKRADDKKTITSIKEIRRIYAILRDDDTIDTDQPYYYTYQINGAEVGADSIPTGPNGEVYVEVFDCHWITHPDTASYYGGEGGPSAWVEPTERNPGRAYYFEVPVNAGEYAIGSTSGKVGAYLVYLDLAANVQQFERTETYEEITENTTDTTIPQGVDWLTAKPTGEGDDTLANAIDPMNSAFVSITTDASGNIVFTKSDGTKVTVGANALSGVLPGYIGVSNTLSVNGTPMTTAPGKTIVIKRTTYYDYNVNTKATTVTVVETVNEVKQDPQYTTYDADGNAVTLEVPIYPDQWINKTKEYTKLSDLIDLLAIVKWEKPTSGTVDPPITVETKFTVKVNNGSGASSTVASKVYDIYLTCAENVKGDLKATLKDAGVSSGATFNIYVNNTKVATLTSATTQTVSINTTEAAPPAEQQ